MNITLDTNAYSDFMRGVPGRVRIIQTTAYLGSKNEVNPRLRRSPRLLASARKAMLASTMTRRWLIAWRLSRG